MTFDGRYLTYAEYQALGGSAIGEMPFNLLEFEARTQIDIRTQFRLVGVKTIPEKVKLCDFHLMQKISGYINKKVEESNIASESIDGYSISYFNADEIKKIIELHKYELEDIMKNDLYGVIVNNEAILYDGVK